MKPLLSLLLFAYPLAAGEQGVNCSAPVVFPNAEVNAVVLPYDYLGSNAVLERSATAQRLSLLLQRNILFSLLKYPSIASVQLVKRGMEPCDPGVVADQLLKKRPGSPRPLGPQKTAVMLWGNFYEEGDALYVRSFLRLVRNYPEGEQLAMKVGDASFVGAMPVKTVAFPPTRITAAELRQIDAQFRALNKVRSEPNDAAPAREIPLDPATPFSYSIARVQGEWMYVEPMVSGPAGWVKAGAHLSDLPLRKKMPELSFLDGVVAYVFAALAGPQTPASARWTAQAMEAMNRFTADAHLAENSSAQAWIAAVRAAASLKKSTAKESWAYAQEQFQKASDLAPANVDLEHMALLCRIWLNYKAERRESPELLARELRDIAARSDDPRPIANLEQLYRLMIASGQGNESTKSELAKVQRIRALPVPR